MKRTACFLLMLLACLSLAVSCAAQPGKQDAITFAEGQYFAAAYLGYQEMTDLDAYARQYLDSDRLPVFHLSDGDYYLLIPRYEGMELSLYRNDLDTGAPSLVYEDPDCGPFILQCNVSDIFADATVELRYEDETVTFSPFISLKDGSVDIGTQGLLLTK